MLVEVKMQLAYHLWEEKVPARTISERLEVHRSTVYRWIGKFRLFGLKRLKSEKNDENQQKTYRNYKKRKANTLQ